MILADWLRRETLTDEQFASRIGVTREYARLLRKGQREPSAMVMNAIIAATGGEVDQITKKGKTYGAMGGVPAV